MSNKPSCFPIPKIWVLVYLWLSCLIVCAISAVVSKIHELGKLAESRGWIYYHRSRIGGVKANVVLDLEMWVSGRAFNQYQSLRGEWFSTPSLERRL